MIVKAQRRRIVSICAAAVVVALGLWSRSPRAILPEFTARYAGDTLWALLVFIVLGVLFVRASTWNIGWAALTIACLVEVSQLYRAPWIDHIRHTRWGGLLLGQGFLWSDFICYMTGIALGVACEVVIHRQATTNSTPA